MSSVDRVSPYVFPGLRELTGTVVLHTYVRELCEELNVPLQGVLGRSRIREYAELRQVCMWVMRRYEKKTFYEIGRLFGRDHATAVHACRKMNNLLEVGDKQTLELQKVAKRIYLYQKTKHGEAENL
jgi:chromosomal replication initiation ATPase DnaA